MGFRQDMFRLKGYGLRVESLGTLGTKGVNSFLDYRIQLKDVGRRILGFSSAYRSLKSAFSSSVPGCLGEIYLKISLEPLTGTSNLRTRFK